MPAADLVGGVDDPDGVGPGPLTATGRPTKATVSSGSTPTDASQCLTPMIGSTISKDTSRGNSSVLASCVAPSMLASVE